MSGGSDTVYCRQCGYQVPAGEQHCGNCGAEVRQRGGRAGEARPASDQAGASGGQGRRGERGRAQDQGERGGQGHDVGRAPGQGQAPGQSQAPRQGQAPGQGRASGQGRGDAPGRVQGPGRQTDPAPGQDAQAGQPVDSQASQPVRSQAGGGQQIHSEARRTHERAGTPRSLDRSSLRRAGLLFALAVPNLFIGGSNSFYGTVGPLNRQVSDFSPVFFFGLLFAFVGCAYLGNALGPAIARAIGTGDESGWDDLPSGRKWAALFVVTLGVFALWAAVAVGSVFLFVPQPTI